MCLFKMKSRIADIFPDGDMKKSLKIEFLMI